jgi:hypothetical protein
MLKGKRSTIFDQNKTNAVEHGSHESTIVCTLHITQVWLQNSEIDPRSEKRKSKEHVNVVIY